MALPLPKLLADMPEGGRLIGNANQMNALTKQALENQYYGLTARANAGSKMAYQQLMGPQFIAKLLGNPDLVGNLTEGQKGNAVSDVYNAGMGGASNNAIANSPGQGSEGGSSGLLGMLKNVLTKGLAGAGGSGEQASSNALTQSNQGQGTSQNAMTSPPATSRMPEDPNEGKMGMGTEPQVQQSAQPQEWKPGDSLPPPSISGNKTFAEKAGEHKGIIKQGEKAGDIRAKDAEDLDNTVMAGENSQKTYDNLIQDIASPGFANIRNVPLAQQHELAYYAKEGTKVQQQMIGDFLANAGQVVVDTSQKFSGAFRKGEQALINTMKVNPSDTIDVAKGKLEALAYTNKFLTERSRLTSEYIQQYHLSKGQALEQADKLLKGENFRQDIHDKLNPTVTISFNGEKQTLPVAEARRRRVKGV